MEIIEIFVDVVIVKVVYFGYEMDLEKLYVCM